MIEKKLILLKTFYQLEKLGISLNSLVRRKSRDFAWPKLQADAVKYSSHVIGWPNL